MDEAQKPVPILVLCGEALGSAVIVFVGAAAVCLQHASGFPLGRFGVALVSGFAVCSMIFALRPLSGGYLNPAVTLGGWIWRRMSLSRAWRLVLSQIVGAALAGILLRYLFVETLAELRLGAPSVAAGTSMTQALLLEALIAALWVGILAATDWRSCSSHVAPWAVGLCYGAAVLVLGTTTGAAGNPARSFGPAFGSGIYVGQLLYWIGPLAGGMVAAAAGWIVFRPRAEMLPAPAAVLEAAPELVDSATHYQQGIALYRQGQLEAAAEQFSLATEDDPGWAQPYYYIGIIYRDFGDEENAAKFFTAARHYRRDHGATAAPHRG